MIKMAPVISLVFCCIIASAAMAEVVIVKGSSHWTARNRYQDTDLEYSVLEQLGVRQSAADKAVKQCVDMGLSDCVILNSTIVRCPYRITDENRRDFTACDGEATVRGTK